MADRYGIEQKEIATILREVAGYLRHKNIGDTYNGQLDNWLNTPVLSDEKALEISNAVIAFEKDFKRYQEYTNPTKAENKEANARIKTFMKMERSWVETYGYPNLIEKVSDEAFGFFLPEEISREDRDFASYWPRKLIPTLIEYKKALWFFEAKGDKKAKDLIEKIDSFQGARGRCHASITGTMTELDAFIENNNKPSAPRPRNNRKFQPKG